MLTDPAVPVPGTAKVKLLLNRRSDDNILGFARENIVATTANPNFVSLIPSAVDFLAVVNDFDTLLTAAKNADMAAKAVTTLKNQARAVLELLFTQRGNYVQTLSLGDPAIIQSAALNVKNPPTPIGTLPPPLGLRVDLNGTVGKMILNWSAVNEAHGLPAVLRTALQAGASVDGCFQATANRCRSEGGPHTPCAVSEIPKHRTEHCADHFSNRAG